MSTRASSEAELAELLTLNRHTDANGTIRYYNSDKRRHRIHGPAVIWKNGTKIWYYHGKLHREDGPAYIDAESGYKEWRRDGVLHREDGPAVEYQSGEKEYWYNGKQVSMPESITPVKRHQKRNF